MKNSREKRIFYGLFEDVCVIFFREVYGCLNIMLNETICEHIQAR